MLRAERFRWKDVLHSWRPRPDTGNAWIDALWISVLITIEQIPLDDLVGHSGLIDLTSPWIVIAAVTAIPSRLLLVALLAGIARETHSAAPAGLYVSIYTVVCLAVLIARDTMSWRHPTPWFATLAVALGGVAAAELFVLTIVQGPHSVTMPMLLTTLGRVAIGVVFGMFLCRSRLTLIPDTPRPDPEEVAT